MSEIPNNINFESSEPKLEVEVLTQKQFQSFLYPNNFQINDSRFEAKDNGGVFVHFEASDTLQSDLSDILYSSEGVERKFFVVSKEDGIIVGIAALEISEGGENAYWVKAVDVDPKYQGKGHGRRLIEGIFDFAREKNSTLIGSFRTDMGEERMGHIFEELSQKTGVTYIPAVDDRRV